MHFPSHLRATYAAPSSAILIRSSKKFLARNSLHTFLSLLLLPLIGLKYLLQYSGLIRPLSTFFCQRERPIFKTSQNFRQNCSTAHLSFTFLNSRWEEKRFEPNFGKHSPTWCPLNFSVNPFFLVTIVPRSLKFPSLKVNFNCSPI